MDDNRARLERQAPVHQENLTQYYQQCTEHIKGWAKRLKQLEEGIKEWERELRVINNDQSSLLKTEGSGLWPEGLPRAAWERIEKCHAAAEAKRVSLITDLNAVPNGEYRNNVFGEEQRIRLQIVADKLGVALT